MFICKYCKLFLLFTLLFYTVHATVNTHKFDIESGIVFYTITGGGVLTKETNLNIKGSAHLRFREWGAVMLEEEGGTVITTGAIKHKQEVKRFEKHSHDKIISVDYKNEQILERIKNKEISSQIEETNGLLQRGQAVISGHLCKIWIGPGIQKCIYKGIVLKQESHVMGISYVKVATQMHFDINVSKEKCGIPDYPVQRFGLFNDNMKTVNAAKSDNFCKILKETSFHLEKEKIERKKVKVEDKVRQKFINYIGKDIFKRQKELLPKLLDALKDTRACLYSGDNPFLANQCLEPFTRLKEHLGTQEDDYIILWDEERKSELLDKIEDELIYRQSRIPCVKRAKNITDLSSCMK